MGRRGFSLVELVCLVGVLASTTAVFAPIMKEVRGASRGASSEGNLMVIGQGSASYSMVNAGAIPSFSWRAGIEYPNLKNGKTKVYSNDQDAAAAQLQYILQKETGRISGTGAIRRPYQILVHRRYNHIPLAEFMGNVGGEVWVDPEDELYGAWRLDPLGYLEWCDEVVPVPYQCGFPNQQGYDTYSNLGSIEVMQLWAFGSSYLSVPAAWSNDAYNTYAPTPKTPHLFRAIGFSIPLGMRRMDQVSWAANKVQMYEEFDRAQEGDPYFAYDHARPAKLMFDGSVNTRASGEARSSVSPEEFPTYRVWTARYLPLDRFPIPLGGLRDDTELDYRYRWTYGGLRGYDYAPSSPFGPRGSR